MSTLTTAMSAEELKGRIGTPSAPILFDVCRSQAFCESNRVIAGARWRDHMLADVWGRDLDPTAEIVVSCVHGQNVSQLAASKLRALGLRARYLEGGTDGFLEEGGVSVLRKPLPHDLNGVPSRWSHERNRRSIGWRVLGSSGDFSTLKRKSFMSRRNGLKI